MKKILALLVLAVCLVVSISAVSFGEGAKFVASRQVGYTSEPGDYEALRANIERLRDMPAEEFQTMSGRCIAVSRNELDFDKQMKEAYEWLSKVES